MNILGIESSWDEYSVAVQAGGRMVVVPGPAGLPFAHGLFTAVEQAVAQAGIVMADLDRIAVGLGPGSYTGVRLAVTAARGLAWSLEIPIAGVASFQALAATVAAAAGGAGPVVIVADARVEELFAGRYRVTPAGVVEEELRVIKLGEAAGFIPAGSRVAGPGLLKHGAMLRAAAAGAEFINGWNAPGADMVIRECERGGSYAPAVDGTAAPLYLKASEPERRRAAAGLSNG
jgi:tRNA threonylcarbamoyladenosine biosynthesis protein TsaB